MNYIGSKYSLLPFIEQTFQSVSDGDERIFCDIFAGTGIVGRHFKKLGFRVISNDIQYYAYALNKAYIEINHQPVFEGLRRTFTKDMALLSGLFEDPVAQSLGLLNKLPGKQGFIAKNYGPQGNRFYYAKENAERADAIRQALDEWQVQGLITEHEFYYLLCSLLEAIDQVANTASVYGAFLKSYKGSALKPLSLKPLALTNHVTGSQVFNQDANGLIGSVVCDVLYLDPPYNHRQYGANYHVLETIAAYDNPVLKGVTGMREYFRSPYCQARGAVAALEELVTKARTKHILLSYNDEGLLSLDDVNRILSLRGKPQTFKTEYNRFKADNGRTYKRDATVEYIHYVRVIK